MWGWHLRLFVRPLPEQWNVRGEHQWDIRVQMWMLTRIRWPFLSGGIRSLFIWPMYERRHLSEYNARYRMSEIMSAGNQEPSYHFNYFHKLDPLPVSLNKAHSDILCSFVLSVSFRFGVISCLLMNDIQIIVFCYSLPSIVMLKPAL